MNINNAEIYCIILLLVLMISIFFLVRVTNERDSLKRDFKICKARLEKITKLLNSFKVDYDEEYREIGLKIESAFKNKNEAVNFNPVTPSPKAPRSGLSNHRSNDCLSHPERITPIVVDSSPAPYCRDEPISNRSSGSHSDTFSSCDSGSSYSSGDSGSSCSSASSCD